MARAFGTPATDDRAKAEAVARACEQLGYSSIWTNDGSADGIATARWMSGATSTIRVGIGVVACDRTSPRQLIEKVNDHRLPLERLVLGIGSGFSAEPVDRVRSAVNEVRDAFGGSVRIGVAAMGPRMCAAAGELADVILLNWMTPQRISWARKQIAKGASRSGNTPEIASYIRVAVGEGAPARIASEAARYASIPHYGKHFGAMSVAPSEVGIAAVDHEISDALWDYEQVLDEAVVRGIPETDAIESTLRIVRAAAPA